MNAISTFLDKIYSYEYFAPIIFGLTAFLIVLFFIILFFGKKDEREKELEQTKKLELASLNAFSDEEIAKELTIEAEEKENPFEKIQEIVEEEQSFEEKYNFPELDLGPTIEMPSIEEQSFTEKYDFPKFDIDVEENKPYVEASKIESEKLAPILDPIENDALVFGNSVDKEKSPEEIKNKFSSLATSIEDELSNIEKMIEESHQESTPEKKEEQPVVKNIPGSKQIFSSVFVSPSKEETTEYDNDDFKNKFNSLLKDDKKQEELSFTQKYDFPKFDTEVKEEQKDLSFTQKYDFPKFDTEVNETKPSKPINFTIKERVVTKPVDLPKKADVDLPKLNEAVNNEKITKADFPEFPSITNELESFKR